MAIRLKIGKNSLDINCTKYREKNQFCQEEARARINGKKTGALLSGSRAILIISERRKRRDGYSYPAGCRRGCK